MTSVLAGRKVVVTRAAEQADELATLLEARGAVPVVIPLIEIEPVTDPEGAAELASDSASSLATSLANCDWLIVTSPNGAKHVARHYAKTVADQIPAQVTAQVTAQIPAQVAAIGTATAEVLRAAGISVALVPAVQSAVGLLAELGSPARVVIVQAANAEPTLADGLRARGTTVAVVAPYRTVPARVTAAQQLAALSADAVLFASGSAARAWADVFGDATPPVVAVIGPQTAAAATDAGLKVSLVAADHSLSGLVAALERHLSSQR